MLHQVALIICLKPMPAKEGGSVDFKCEYPAGIQNNSKFFCRATPMCRAYLIATVPPDRREEIGKFTLQDNYTFGYFVVHMDALDPEDSGTYWCGVKMTENPDIITIFQLNVAAQTSTTRTVETLTHQSPGVSSRSSIPVDKRHLPMFVTVVSCLSSLLIVFLFTLCLIFIIRNWKYSQQREQAREMSAVYEVMKSGVLPITSRDPGCETFSNSPQDPPTEAKCCPDQRQPKQTESTAQKAHTDLEDPGCLSLYQDLDLSSVEEHIYHRISSMS
uniref:Immunoglobulin domain-containing protein n=1 Tax=Knipowitschia caucasica TaxID=637954 RepID=A0AAV2LNI6_KNICA